MGDSFDLAAFNETMDKAFDYLEELHAIDAILDGIESRGLDHPYVSQNSPSTGGGAEMMQYNTTIQIGHTDPFSKLIRTHNVTTTTPGYPASAPPQTSVSEIDLGFIDDAGPSAASWRSGAQADVSDLVEQIVAVPASRFRSVAYSLVDQYAKLFTTVGDNWDQLGTRSGEFEGDTADTYFQFFSEPVGQIRLNHCFAIDHLASMVTSLKAVNDCGQHSVMNLALMTKDVARKQLKKRADDSRAGSSSDALSLLATGFGIVAAFTFPVPGASAVLGSISALLGYASGQVPDGVSESATIEGASATEISDLLVSKISKLRHLLSDGYYAVHDKAGELAGDIADMETPFDATTGANYWIPIRSGLHAGDPEFYHETSGEGR